MGDDSYFKLLQEYLRRYKWKIATTQDFQRLAAEICGDTDAIDKLFEQWIYE
jgi:aminopeptidase N